MNRLLKVAVFGITWLPCAFPSEGLLWLSIFEPFIVGADVLLEVVAMLLPDELAGGWKTL
jgi:hypothetical protein